MPEPEVQFAVITISIVFVLLSVIIAALIILYRNKMKRMNLEKIMMYEQFQKTMLQSQLEIQEQTFNTISQEIHDNVGQMLSLAKVQLSIFETHHSLPNEALSHIKENISQAMTDLRDISKSLNSHHIQSVPINELIAAELQRMKQSHILDTSLTEEGKFKPIAAQKKLILFRIVQESLQNILKHAKATWVNVQLEYTAENLCITISDNGRGFDVAQTVKHDGLGLQNITHRATLIGGKASIESSPGRGTTIHLTIPYA